MWSRTDVVDNGTKGSVFLDVPRGTAKASPRDSEAH